MQKDINLSGLALMFSCITGCRKFIQVAPPTTMLSNTFVFSNNSTASAALSGVYVTMEGTNSIGGGVNGISELLGLSADEFNLYPGANALLNQIYSNAQISSNPTTVWFDLYKVIFQANSVITGAQGSGGITTAYKQQLIGEAEFIRAFCNFYLVDIYGNVPIVTSTNFAVNQTLGQSPSSAVYTLIVADLKDAQARLGANYLNGSGNVSNERVRPNSAAAGALLARVYLYMHEYDSADQEATLVLNNPAYKLYQNIAGLDSVFLTNSHEAIWQLELPASDLNNTLDGRAFLNGLLSHSKGPTTSNPYTLSNSFMSSFEPNDLRRISWTDSIKKSATLTYYFPYKYKLTSTGNPPAEYPTLLRLAEQYLIRAEARVYEGNLPGAAADVNVVRARAGLPATAATTQSALLGAIAHERRMELFTEYGHRWMDLRRTGIVDSVMTIITPTKGGSWVSSDSLYPIPLSEVQTDPNLKQNNGYK